MDTAILGLELQEDIRPNRPQLQGIWHGSGSISRSRRHFRPVGIWCLGFEIPLLHRWAGVTTAICLVAGISTPDTAVSAAVRPPAVQPNVILVMTDDQGYGDFSCHGHPTLKTPNMDRLSRESTRLVNYHVDPTCSPTRAALMTGRYAFRTGVWHTVMGRANLRRDEVTMADVFAASGYRTAIFGKWHLGHNYPHRPEYRGFHESLVIGDGGLGTPNDYWGNDRYDDTYYRDGKLEKTEGHCTDVFFDNASKFIRRHRDVPFFLYLPLNVSHAPWSVPDRYIDPFRKAGIEGVEAAFYGTILKTDERLGRLLELLDKERLADNTIVILTTDNGTAGPGRYNAGMRAKKGSEYDGGHRVPFFIRWSAGSIKAGVDIDRLTAHIDVLPTLIELCNLKKPERVKLDGRSLVPLLRGQRDDWPSRTLCVQVGRTDFLVKGRKYAAMTDRWRLVNHDELYDIRRDPGQRKNLAFRHPQVVEQLRAAYDQWWNSISTRFDEFCEVILGAEERNFAMLTIMDWHGPGGKRTASSRQRDVRDGLRTNGFWAVQVARKGLYEVELRRWPRELNAPMTASVDGGKALALKQARLKVGDVDVSQPIGHDASAVIFRVQLEPGKTKMQTWLSDENGGTRGAYYVYVKLTDDIDRKHAANFIE